MCSTNILSKLCRLCSLDIEYGFDIFVESEVKASLVILINKYLPIKVTEDDILPKQICESCHIGVAATVDLIDRMVAGQHRLRKFYNKYLKDLSDSIEINVVHQPNKNQIQNSELQLTEERNFVNSEGNLNEAGTNSNSAQNHSLLQNINIKYLAEIYHPKLKDSSTKKESETTLINIQGNSPDIEMDDLAKGTEVKKVYESHPLGLVVEGKKPKGRRGRPKKNREVLLTQELKTDTNDVDGRPKRRSVLPSRFRDSLAGKDFDNLLGSDIPSTDLERDDEAMNGESILALGENTLVDSNERTHTLEGNTIVITPNHQDETLAKLPDSVNIELDFNDSNMIEEETDENGMPRFSHTPKASVSAIQEFFKPQKKRRGPSRKFKYFCEFCNKGFLQIGRYWHHLKLHKNVVLQCDDCKSRFSNNEDINLHQESADHKGIGVIEVENGKNMAIRCPLCQFRTFLTRDRYIAHVANMHEGQKPFMCSICNKRFAYKHSLKTHHLTHKPEQEKKRYPCKECNKEFFHQSSLIYHKDTHHNSGRKFVCVFCGCSFKHKQLLQRHHAVHSENRPFACKLCGSSFKTKGNLYNHMNTHTRSKIYTCEICSKKFGHITSLNLHLRSHTGEKPFSCTYCGKRFSQNGNLQEHTRIHTGLKPYCCSLCGKKFTTSSQLSLHEKRHRCEYKFSCSVCSKGFYSNDALKIHEQRHRGGKALSCEHCRKIFGDKNQLIRHVKSHFITDKNEKSFKCHVCNKTFNDAFVLSKHVEGHQMEKAWFIAQPSTVEGSSLASSSQDIIYVLPKKEDANLGFLSFNTDEIFDDQERDQLPPANSVVTNLPSNFILPHNNVVHASSDGKVYPLQHQIEVGETGYEPIAFSIPVCDDSSIYVRKVFDT